MTGLEHLAGETTDALADPEAPLSDEALQRLLAAVVRRYADRVANGGATGLAPVPPDGDTTPTEALLVAGGLLRATEVSSFELANMFNL